MTTKSINDVFGKPIHVVNVGLKAMAESVAAQGVAVTDVDWKPSPYEVPYLHTTKSGIDIDQANEEAIRRIKQARPVLVEMGLAKDVIPGYHDHLILHAGPPITWERMCGPMRGAIMGALIYEGMAKDEAEAEKLAAPGEIEYAPCHHYHSVGPMAGIFSPHMPVFIIENKALGNKAYCTMNEGLGKGAALWGDGSRSICSLEVDGNGVVSCPRPGYSILAGRHRHQSLDRPGAPHGRRRPQPKPGRAPRCSCGQSLQRWRGRIEIMKSWPR